MSFKNIKPDRLPAFNTDFFFQVVHFTGDRSQPRTHPGRQASLISFPTLAEFQVHEKWKLMGGLDANGSLGPSAIRKASAPLWAAISGRDRGPRHAAVSSATSSSGSVLLFPLQDSIPL